MQEPIRHAEHILRYKAQENPGRWVIAANTALRPSFSSGADVPPGTTHDGGREIAIFNAPPAYVEICSYQGKTYLVDCWRDGTPQLRFVERYVRFDDAFEVAERWLQQHNPDVAALMRTLDQK